MEGRIIFEIVNHVIKRYVDFFLTCERAHQQTLTLAVFGTPSRLKGGDLE